MPVSGPRSMKKRVYSVAGAAGHTTLGGDFKKPFATSLKSGGGDAFGGGGRVERF